MSQNETHPRYSGPAGYGSDIAAVWLNTAMSKVFSTMGIGLLITFLTAFLVSSDPTVFAAIFGTALKWPVMLAPLVFVFIMSFGYEKYQASTLKILFYIFAILQGAALSVIFKAYTGASILGTLGLTTGMFMGMSAYGYFTKRSLHNLGGYLFVALIALIVAMVVNMFLHSSAMETLISCVGVLVFLALTAYDTQQIRYTLWGEKNTDKAIIMGALSLYLDFVNLLLFFLRLFGVKTGKD